jgi:amino acid transporter
MLTAVPLIALAYLLPVATGLSVSPDWEKWDTGHLPQVAEAVGGWALGSFVTAGALFATAGLFLAGLLTNSRLPYALASLGQLPAWLGSVSARTGTPWAAVVLSSLCYSAFAVFSFKELIVLNIWLYSIALLLELAAFVALRLREPALPRPWRVGGGALGMWLVAVLPAALSVLAMATAGWQNTVAGVIAALTGPAVYWLAARRAPSAAGV